jgi:hypothetical protein
MKTWRTVKCFTSPGVASQPPVAIDREKYNRVHKMLEFSLTSLQAF